MTVVPKTTREIIDEMVEFYGADPEHRRAMDEHSTCRYLMHSPDGPRKCAVGRCMIAPEKIPAHSTGISVRRLQEATGESLDDLLLPEYRGHSLDFWERLQSIHDGSHFWNEKGLSEGGGEEVKALLDKFGQGFEPGVGMNS